jgi:hypothetical protein
MVSTPQLSEEIEHTSLVTDHAAKTDIHVNPGDTDRYKTLVVQCVLSAQVAPSEKNQWHSLFPTKGVV